MKAFAETLATGAPANEADLAALAATKFPFPADYLEFLKRSDGGGDDDFQIHSIKDVLGYHASNDYGMAEVGLIYVATDGGGTGYCLRRRGAASAFVAVPLDSADDKTTWEACGATFQGLIRKIERERKELESPPAAAVPAAAPTLKPGPEIPGGSVPAHFTRSDDVLFFGAETPEDGQVGRRVVGRFSLATFSPLAPLNFGILHGVNFVLCLTQDGSRIAQFSSMGGGGDSMGAILVHEVNGLRELARFSAKTKAIGSICQCYRVGAFFDQGRQILTNERDQTVVAYDIATGAQKTLGKHTKVILHLSITRDCRWAATCGEDKQIRLWDLKNLCEVERFGPQKSVPESLAWSPDGSRLLATSFRGRLATLFDAGSGKPIFQLRGARNDRIASAAFTPNGKYLVTIGSAENMYAPNPENPIDLRDPETGDILCQVKFFGGLFNNWNVGSMAITRDSRYLVFSPNIQGAKVLTWELPA